MFSFQTWDHLRQGFHSMNAHAQFYNINWTLTFGESSPAKPTLVVFVPTSKTTAPTSSINKIKTVI